MNTGLSSFFKDMEGVFYRLHVVCLFYAITAENRRFAAVPDAPIFL